ncbi:Rap1a/Tai family immunity protein [Pseudomonas sp. KK4]|uniref:Rap1a/Tai family immunity protein n=1 Tax=Pseudomonas sp. KK4 TaxID=1855729 RepID=UPI001115AA87|nr:Rap1a/Tai family immunity protein [Pseudomonas sp. KK4]
MKAWTGAVTLAGMLACSSVMADGNELLENCQASIRSMDHTSNNDPYGNGQCFGVTEGVLNTMVALNPKLPKESRICLPDDGIKGGQAVRVVYKYLQDNPSLLHLEGTTLISFAFRRAYPCE